MRAVGTGLASPRLRVRVRRAILGLTVGALALFVIPLAVAAHQVTFSAALTRAQRDATRAVSQIPDNVIRPGGKVPVTLRTDADTSIGVYSASGRLVVGVGPTTSSLAKQATDGREHDGQESGYLAVVIPVPSDTNVVGSVRAGVPLAILWRRVALLWGLLALLAAASAGLVAIVAARVSRRIALPFEELTTASRALGAGSFALSLPEFGILEADEAAAALKDTAARLGTLVRRERDFTQHASHQLRTPLAGLLIGIDAALEPGSPTAPSAALRTASDRARQLEHTIDDLLTVRLDNPRAARIDAVEAARAAINRWSASPLASGRSIRLRADTADAVAAPHAVLRQCLDVLIDNALRHGSSDVTVTVERLGELLSVEVADEGTGFAEDVVPGLGLQLAEGLAQSCGGRILIRRRAPRARVALLLPTGEV